MAQQVEGQEARERQARVTFLQGKAEVLTKDDKAWKSTHVGTWLSQDDEVRTGEKSRIEIQLPDRSILRFDERTHFKLKTLFFEAQKGSREIQVNIVAGKTWANVRKAFGPQRTFEVASVNAVAGVRDTIWRMTIGEDQSTLIRVYEGTVEVYNPFIKPDYKPQEGGFRAPREVRGPSEVPPPFREVTREEWEQIVLTQMKQVIIPAVGRPGTPTDFSSEEDQREEWVRWNRERDRALP